MVEFCSSLMFPNAEKANALNNKKHEQQKQLPLQGLNWVVVILHIEASRGWALLNIQASIEKSDNNNK